ncbi:hypothetical protein CYLTODRAFT_23661, partial [Cylindrobasidium torrendii FP15055 ss-10]
AQVRRKRRRHGKSKRTKKRRSQRTDSESSNSSDEDSSDGSSDAPVSPKRRRLLDEEPKPKEVEMDYNPEAGRFKDARDVVENLRNGLKKELFSYDFTAAKIARSLDEARGKVAQDVHFSNGTWKKTKEQRLLTIELSASEFSEVMRRAARTVGREFAPGGKAKRRGKKVAKKLQEHLEKIADILIEKVRPQSGGVSPAKLLAAKTLYDELFTTLFDDIREQRKRNTLPDDYSVINVSKWNNMRWLDYVMNAEDDLNGAGRGGVSQWQGNARGATHPSSSRPERTQHQRHNDALGLAIGLGVVRGTESGLDT